MRSFLVYFLIVVSLLAILTSCAFHKENPVSSSGNYTTDGLSDSSLSKNCDNHLLLGSWIVDIDIENLSAQIKPGRYIAAHYNVTTLLPPPGIVVNSFDPLTNIVDVDVKIKNTYPIDVYDVRLIIYTDNIGHMLVNNDGWINLFDIPGGLQANPFMAYAKFETQRKFSGMSEHTENLQIFIPAGNPDVAFAIDASYPGNCDEPYKFGDVCYGYLHSNTGDFADLGVRVSDWQTDVDSVEFTCPQITAQANVPLAQYDLFGADWRVTIINNTGVPVGDYSGYISATSTDAGSVKLYKSVTISVVEEKEGWGRNWGKLDYDTGLSVTTDNSGNVYVFGFYMEAVDFDPGSGEDVHVSNGENDLFLCKYDNEGNFLWARTWGGSEEDIYTFLPFDTPKCDVITDESGNVYVTGSYQGTVDFDPGPAEEIHVSNGYFDTFLSKFDKDGNFLWTGAWGGSMDNNYHYFDCGYGLAFDNSGDLYVTGSFTDTADFDPSGDGVDEHTANPMGVFLNKFEPNGDFLWAKTWGRGGKTVGFGVTIDDSNYIYVTGRYSGWMIDFDPGSGEDFHSSGGDHDAFLSRLNTNGDFVWAITWGGYDDLMSETFGKGLITDSSGNIYVGGGFIGVTDFDPGSGIELHGMDRTVYDGYMSKFDPDSNFLWVIVWGVSDGDNQDDCTDLSIDSFDNIYVTCRRGADHTWNFGKFDVNGTEIWLRNLNMTKIFDCEPDNNGNIFLTGHYGAKSDFDPGPGKDYHVSYGSYDACLIKILPNGYWE